jgi:hypothetical protein
MRYRDPRTILSPRDAIRSVEIIFEDPNSVSVARIQWYDTTVTGIRWNIALREWDDEDKINEVKECLGMPVSRGYPTWFILPDEITKDDSGLSYALKKILK